LYELRRLSTYVDDPDNPYEKEILAQASAAVPRYPAETVFYEFYWAFHYRDTKPILVLRWVLSTLWSLLRTRRVLKLRRRLISVIAACVGALLVFVLAIFLVALGIAQLKQSNSGLFWGTLWIALGVIVPRVMPAFRPVFVGWVGDAARYFGRSPDNPMERQEIRKAGIELLTRLHGQTNEKTGRNEYDDIVIVGHSLGSVIAYDIITNYWIAVNRNIRFPITDPEICEMQRIVGDGDPAPDGAWEVGKCGEEFRNQQQQLVAELKKSTLVVKVGDSEEVKVRDVWRVRHLITLGSPLTYSRFLLAKDAHELYQRQALRELPTCPPSPFETLFEILSGARAPC
jgi:hypothetical protein